MYNSREDITKNINKTTTLLLHCMHIVMNLKGNIIVISLLVHKMELGVTGDLKNLLQDE